MKYPYECCRCGLCCVNEQCPVSIEVYGVKDSCPALSFNGDEASCALVGIVPVGDGCCIKARIFMRGEGERDYSSLSSAQKRLVVQRILDDKSMLIRQKE